MRFLVEWIMVCFGVGVWFLVLLLVETEEPGALRAGLFLGRMTEAEGPFVIVL
jgi:hypothetical protein